jgi:general secretion pathway protein F
LLRLPLLGRLIRGYNAARFGGTLAMLAGAGVPILKALQAAAETLGNRAMRHDALDALVQVREGAPLASALAGKKRFPGLLAMFARLGEQTGQLPRMLDRARPSCRVRFSAARWVRPPSWSPCSSWAWAWWWW